MAIEAQKGDLNLSYQQRKKGTRDSGGEYRSCKLQKFDDKSAAPVEEDDGKKKNMAPSKKSESLNNRFTKEELERFYDAYQKHGRDWKRVAAVVRNNRHGELPR